MNPTVDFSFENFIGNSGNILLADCRRKPKFQFAIHLYNAWFEGKPQKIELLIVYFERWLLPLVSAAIYDFRLLPV